MVGCGRCDDWFHGDCVGLDLDKVQQMEQEDQEYVCLRCCDDEDVGKAEPGGSDPATKDHPPKSDPQPPPRNKQQGVTTGGLTTGGLTAGGVRPFRKVSHCKPPSIQIRATGSSIALLAQPLHSVYVYSVGEQVAVCLFMKLYAVYKVCRM